MTPDTPRPDPPTGQARSSDSRAGSGPPRWILAALAVWALVASAGWWHASFALRDAEARARQAEEKAAAAALDLRESQAFAREQAAEIEGMVDWIASLSELGVAPAAPADPVAGPEPAGSAPSPSPAPASGNRAGGPNRALRAAFDDREWKTFQDMRGLYAASRFAELADLAEAEIERDPDWLLPYAQGGMAHAKMGNLERASELLAVVEERAPDEADPRLLPYYRAALYIFQAIR